MTEPSRERLPLVLLISGLLLLVWSGAFPNDRVVWFMETLPAMAGAAILVATRRRFPMSRTSYLAVWIFSCVLIVGGHYTYAEVPIGNWAKDAFDLERNHYDRFGHFLQGVIPALLARELLVRTSPLRPGGWLFTCCVCIALAISASYELIEWWFAEVFGGEQAHDFLGSQGDVWDAQKDMLMALMGAASAYLLLGRVQQREIDALAAA